ncbi:cryptochrome DASH [Xenopus laevis]|uniref:Cryptochrome DASH n=1 Tax=Xenopus laevis TaxID=8355 RepID=CRYD_XENLA|nr:cryptochrome DASH [Xenopus laevis]Q75WS4.1 RecName: Full=Cryptochrome DASH [Xenopus laevis]BAD08601.1 cryptochrome dash [Xenopus laevis]
MCVPSRVIICLLRNDLRLHDNEVLHWAHRNADQIVPLYCFDPRHYVGTHYFNFPKTGPHRLKFLLESVRDLRITLKKKGSNLLLRRGKPEEVIEDLVKQLGNVSAVTLHEEATKEETDVESAVKQACTRLGIKYQTFWGSTLYHREDLPFRHISSLPDVYTQFRKAVETQGKVRPTFQMPDKLKPLPSGLEEGSVPSHEDFDQQDPLTDPRTAFPCSGGESQALQRLEHYFWETNLVASYKDTRNGLIGLDYSTKFAPWLALGCVSPRYIYEQIGKYEKERTANQSTYWVIFELLWRDYFRFVALKYGRRIFFLRGLQDKDIPWKRDPKLFDAWKEGRTGVPFVDANMRELAMTGFMSNRGRQNVASFLTKDLGIDWRMGAEWFEYLLVDYDVCSNYGNWLYSAGIGNDPRENRKFNMIKQGLDYDSGGDYIRLWVPELQQIKGGDAHTPWALSNASLAHANLSLGETYPYPIVMAPEWSRHINQKPAGSWEKSARRGKGPSHTPKQHKNRGIDFYFSRNKDV